jgi:cytochrome c biogenesis protein CcmG/thiol:disulfide interchange protein DsbE
MARRLRVLAGMLLALAAIALAAVLGLASHPATGRAAPALPRETLVGGPVTLRSLLAGTGGRPALVVFWASWCGPCGEEAPAVERFATSAAGRGRIVGVDWSDARSGAIGFLRRHHWTFPNLRDGEGLVGDSYRLTVLPTTFVLDGRGRISATLRGPQSVASLTRALASAERS